MCWWVCLECVRAFFLLNWWETRCFSGPSGVVFHYLSVGKCSETGFKTASTRESIGHEISQICGVEVESGLWVLDVGCSGRWGRRGLGGTS